MLGFFGLLNQTIQFQVYLNNIQSKIQIQMLFIYYWIVVLHLQVKSNHPYLDNNAVLKMENDQRQTSTFADSQSKYLNSIGREFGQKLQQVSIVGLRNENDQLRNDNLNIQQDNVKPNIIPIISAGNNIVLSEKAIEFDQKLANKDLDMQRLINKIKITEDDLFTNNLINKQQVAIISQDRPENINFYHLASVLIDAIQNTIERSSKNNHINQKQALQNQSHKPQQINLNHDAIEQLNINNEETRSSQPKREIQLIENIKIRRHISTDKKLSFIICVLSFGGGCILLIKIIKLHEQRYSKEIKGVKVPQEELEAQQI